MSFFIVIFLSIYSALHGYVFAKSWQALRFRLPTGVGISVFLLLMVLTPFIIRFLERGQYYSTARLAAYIGYSWMGFLFLFFSVLLLSDILRFFAFALSFATKINLSVIVSAYRPIFFVALAGALAMSVWGFFEARNVHLNTILIKTNKIPKEIGTLTIAQISDVHLGLLVREERLRKIVSLVKAANPDILVSTGDLIDGDIDRLNGLSSLLESIKPRFGKFAVTGNHEFYAGLDKALDFTRKTGFVMLRGKGVSLANVLNIVGVDDPAGQYFHEKRDDEYGVLSSLPRRYYTILLKHQPVVDKRASTLFDLQISGHTHKGQIFPFRYLVRLSTPFPSGLYRLNEGVWLYVSNGSGTWGPPMRFLAPPEVTIIKLVHDE